MKKIDQDTKEYIDLKKVEIVRSNLTVFAYFCTAETFRIFEDTAEYAIQHLDELFEDNNLPYEPSSKKGFNEENFKEAVSLLMDNFSKEKYEDVLKIGHVLFGESDDSKVQQEKKHNYNNNKRNSGSENHKKQQRSSVSPVVIGAVVVITAFLFYKIMK